MSAVIRRLGAIPNAGFRGGCCDVVGCQQVSKNKKSNILGASFSRWCGYSSGVSARLNFWNPALADADGCAAKHHEARKVRKQGDIGVSARPMTTAPLCKSESESNASSDVFAGKVEEINHQKDGGWCVATVVDRKTNDRVKVAGVMPGLENGSSFKFHCDRFDPPRYGAEFEAKCVTVYIPREMEGLAVFLADKVTSVGQSLADRIVEKFGKESYAVLSGSDAATRLQEVDGIGKMTAKRIPEEWQTLSGADHLKVLERLTPFGISNLQCFRIAEKYAHRALEVIEENPYRLYRAVEGITFETADKIALSRADFAPDNPLRLGAAVSYELEKVLGKGDTAMLMPRLLQNTWKVLKLDEPFLADTMSKIDSMVKKGDIEGVVFSEFDGSEYAQLSKLAEDERFIADFFIRSRSKRPKLEKQSLKTAEKDAAISQFSESQTAAMNSAAENRVVVVTGGPGTGKTALVPALLSILKGKRVAVVAFTGKAAKRLSEFIQGETEVDETVYIVSAMPEEDFGGDDSAQTIHRLLHSSRDGIFRYGADNRLDFDCVILDEASLVEVSLLADLLRALPAKCDLVIMGDADQLPSVGPGQALHDIIKSECVPVTCLEKIFRQAPNSSVIKWAHAVKQGDIFLSENQLCAKVSDLTDDKQVQFVSLQGGDRDVADVVLQVYSDLRQQRGPTDDVQILVPQKKSEAGIDAINKRLQDSNPAPKPDWTEFKVGDKVMQERNNYELDIFNGTVGIVKANDEKNATMTVDFGGRILQYGRKDGAELKHLTLAYAMTVHKSQGSEYAVVIVVLSNLHWQPMLRRKLLYTALTRAKEKVIVIGDPKAYKLAVENNPDEEHCGLLYHRLMQK